MRTLIDFWKRGWHGFRRLHLALYILFALMMSLGGLVASLFEQYSIVDFKRGITEIRRSAGAKARGEVLAPEAERLREAFKPMDRSDRPLLMTPKSGAQYDLRVGQGAGTSWWPYLVIVVWLWPLYRYYFSSKPQNERRVEQRIVDLPLFLFALTWLAAVAHYFSRVGTYRELYGDPDARVKITFAAGAFLLGAFAGYLNLELTQLYVRKRIARPFFRDHNHTRTQERIARRAHHAVRADDLLAGHRPARPVRLYSGVFQLGPAGFAPWIQERNALL